MAIWAKSNNRRLSYLRFSTFPQAILGVRHSAQRFSGMREPNFTKVSLRIRRSSQRCTFVSEFGYLAAFSNAGGGLKVEWNFKQRQIWHFLTSLKISGGVCESSIYQLLKFYLRPNLRITMSMSMLSVRGRRLSGHLVITLYVRHSSFYSILLFILSQCKLVMRENL